MNTTNHLPINPACFKGVWYEERYTVLHHPEILFFKRGKAIKEVSELAIAKKTTLIILLNGFPFIEVKKYGNHVYIYQPEKDFKTSPALKEFFISRGFVAAA